MKTNKTLFGVITAILLATVGAGIAQGPPNYAVFDLCQVYTSSGFYNAPAKYYDQTVAIHYYGENRWIWNPKNHHFNLRIVGTATVYDGTSCSGTPIDERPFENTESWIDSGNTWGWPARWWNCGVEVMNYYWTIPGVYQFYATKHGNTWSYLQTAYTSPPDVSGASWSCP